MNLKLHIGLYLLFVAQMVNAQVGIGTTLPNAQLDIVSSNQAIPANIDGILIPKINTFPTTNPTVLQQSMLVYLTTTTTFASISRAPGFYYWDNPTTNWIGIQTTANINWSILGNAGTSSATNFIGTTDNVDLVIRRNNIRSGFIGNPNTAGGNMNTSFGANSLNASGTGTRNVSMGTNVLPSNTTGNTNTVVGERAMFSNTTGSYNVAIGTGALYSNQIGDFNTAIGRNALPSSTNSAYNTVLGYNAGYTTTGSYNVFLGSNAGYSEIGSDKLYISNSNADSNNALVYGDFAAIPNKIFRINGQLQIGNQGTTGYNFPTTRGTNAQILQTDGVGTLSWVNPNSTLSVVRTTLSANQVIASTGWQKITFNMVAFDTGSEFVIGSNSFLATKAGFYEINAGFHTFNKNDTEQYAIAVYKNGVEYQETAAHHYGDKLISRIINCTLSLAVNDYVEIYIFNGNAPTTIDGYSGKTYFEVKQIR